MQPQTVALFIAGAIFAVGGFTTLIIMLRRVNARFPNGERLKMFGFDQNAILSAYKRHFPSGFLLHLYWIFLTAMFVSMLACAWSAGMFR